MPVTIHPSSIVDPKAVLGEDVHIGPFCWIGSDVMIGSGTRLISHVSILGQVHIGERNTIHSNVVIGGEPQDLGYHGAPTSVVIGDDNILREAVTVHRASEKELGVTSIGSNNYLMAGCHVAHDCHLGSHIVMANNTMLGGHVRIQDYAALSGCLGIHQFVTIGSYSFIGGLSRITTDVPPYMLVEGNPSEVRCVNLVGLRRRGFATQDIKNLVEAHRLLFRQHLPANKAKAVLEEDGRCTPPVERLFEFLTSQHSGRLGRGRERKAA